MISSLDIQKAISLTILQIASDLRWYAPALRYYAPVRRFARMGSEPRAVGRCLSSYHNRRRGQCLPLLASYPARTSSQAQAHAQSHHGLHHRCTFRSDFFTYFAQLLAVLGKDITQKLYSLNEHLHGLEDDRQRVKRDALWAKAHKRSMSMDAVNTGTTGLVRSTAYNATQRKHSLNSSQSKIP